MKEKEKIQQNFRKKAKSTQEASNQSEAMKPDKKPRLQESLTDASTSGVVGLTQSRVDSLIIDFVIEDMQSLAVVEQPSFIRLVHGLQPMKRVLGRKALTSAVEQRYMNLQSKLMETFMSVKYICTTADIWSSHHRGFFGTTAHWIDSETLSRKSAALSCSRFKGRHTYDAIASTLEQVHVKYGIASKTVLTITDNGTNFVKAFRVFSVPMALPLPAGPTQADIAVTNGDEDSSFADEEIQFADMHAALEPAGASVETDYTLPEHSPCASHTLNLIATHDAGKAKADNAYKKVYYSTMGKCSALWNKWSRSVHAAEVIKEGLKVSLKVPNDTRWNSQYDALNQIRGIVAETSGEVNLRQICEQLGLTALRPNEVCFLSEYCKVMKPVAKALDICQAENNCYIGILLPTLLSLRNKLESYRQEVRITVPLIDALKHGVETRFAACFDADDLIVAAVSLPHMRLRWCSDDVMKERAKRLLMREMSRCISTLDINVESGCERPCQSDIDTDDDFFGFSRTQSTSNNSLQQECDMYMIDESNTIDILNRFPTVKEVFLRFNTGIPSSAPVERLFSDGGQILTPRRSKLSDDHFEMLLLLRANKNLC